jgi:hypothetical protein
VSSAVGHNRVGNGHDTVQIFEVGKREGEHVNYNHTDNF